jgi:phosphatidate cytidylyltransferase
LAAGEIGVRAGGELRRRTVAGIAAAAVALIALAVGGPLWWLLVAILALVGFAEWNPLVGASRSRMMLAGIILAAALSLAGPWGWGADRSTVALLLILCLLLMLVPRSTGAAWGAAYLGLAAIALLFLRGQPHGIALTLWTMVVVWATDIGAYLAGRRIGGPKLAPRISPNKTWAGLIGGMITALIVGALIAAGTGLPIAALWLGAPLALFAQSGDLFESHLKRQAGVKDSGTLLPGHGGVLDRIDGLLPVAILVAALVANGSF